MKTRIFVLLLIFLALVITLTACGEEQSDIAARPVVRLQVNDRVYDENVYSYCWPESADNVVCDVDAVALVQPLQNVPVTGGDTVQFVLESAAGTPSRFTASLLGFDEVRDLGSGPVAPYDVQLEDNLYRVRVDAEYADVAGHPAYVSYVFGLAVSGVIQPTPTPSPTDTPVPTDTPIPTDTPTPQPTPTLTLAPTLTPVETPTRVETPVPAASETPAQSPAPAAAEGTPPPTTPVVTPVATGDLGLIPVTGSVSVIDQGVTLPVVGATVRYEHSSLARPENASAGAVVTGARGEFTIGPLPLHDTDTLTVTASAPGYIAQTLRLTGLDLWNMAGKVAFVLEPVARPTSVPRAITPTPAGVGEAITSVPRITLTVGGLTYVPVGYQFCQPLPDGTRSCRELPAPDSSTQRLTFIRGAAAQLQIEGARPAAVRLEYLTDTGLLTGQPEERPGDNTVLFTVTPEPGSYILAVRVTWTSYEATYFFRVIVTD